MVRKMSKDTALHRAATLVAGYGLPVDRIATPDKTSILITEPDGSEQTILVDTGNMSPGEIGFLQQKIREGSQLSVMRQEPGGYMIQSKIIISDHTTMWLDDIQSSDVSLTDIITRYKSVLTRIQNMCVIAATSDDTNMKATLQAIIAMIVEDV